MSKYPPIVYYFQFQKNLMSKFTEKLKIMNLEHNKNFPQKLSSVTFICLLSPIIMQKNGEK